MCWSNYMATPIVLKKPLIVYKIGTSSIFGGFISLYRDFMYRESQTMPTVDPEPRDVPWSYDNFYIYEGYHSYLTEEMAKGRMYSAEIGIFEIPVGATVYINYAYREVVSTDIKYLGLLEE